MLSEDDDSKIVKNARIPKSIIVFIFYNLLNTMFPQNYFFMCKG